jgi:hypothetical protein
MPYSVAFVDLMRSKARAIDKVTGIPKAETMARRRRVSVVGSVREKTIKKIVVAVVRKIVRGKRLMLEYRFSNPVLKNARSFIFLFLSLGSSLTALV